MNTAIEHKNKQMDELRRRAERFVASACALGSGTVWGQGPLDAVVAFVGEAPGQQEARQGKPFVGPAGKLFDRELEAAGVERQQIYVTNVVKCRPTAVSPTGGMTNRPPNREEIAAWLPYLTEELGIVRPSVVICLGAVAAKALIKKDFQITKERGKWFDWMFGARIMSTFHPSYILRALAAGGEEQEELFRRDLAEAQEKADAARTAE